MNNAKIVSKHSNLKLLTENYYALIEEFLSKDFELTEKNLLKFINKLHELDYKNKYEKMFAVKTINSMLFEGGTDFVKKEIIIAVNKITNLDKDASNETILAYKVAFLNSYFHEARHEKQFDQCSREGLTSSELNRVMAYEFYHLNSAYNQYSSLIEIDARLNSIERTVDLIKRFDVLKNPEVNTFLMDECVAMLDGINDTAFDMTSYQDDPFSANRIVDKIQKEYTEHFSIYKFYYKIFKNRFVSEFNDKMQDFKDNTLRYLMFNVVAKYRINDEIAKFFGIKNDKNEYVKFFLDNMLTYDNYHFGNLIRLKAKETRDIAKEIVVTQDDITEYLKNKNIEPNETNYVHFFSNEKMLKEFENYIKNKNKQKGYDDLLNAIFNSEGENER